MLRRFLAWVRGSAPSREEVLEAWARDALAGFPHYGWEVW